MIGFNKPFLTGLEFKYMQEACALDHLAGEGLFTNQCEIELKKISSGLDVLITHSCTAALELAALLLEVGPGDEVIIPSFTFVSSANAFVLRGASPVFVDIRADTLNIDETLLEEAITERTKAIVVVHYAGISCEMKVISEIARKHNIVIIEDAAQGIMAEYMEKPLGSFGHLACYSFHETKNIISGEGGCLIINDSRYIDRARILLTKGTNRRSFLNGEVNKYSWVDIGSSFSPSELISAFLLAQLRKASEITERRLRIWHMYHSAFADLEKNGLIRRPEVPSQCKHNGHLYYLILNRKEERDKFIEFMRGKGINCVFHYVPLHLSAYGQMVGKNKRLLPVVEDLSDRLVRLPIWLGIEDHMDKVINEVHNFFSSH